MTFDCSGIEALALQFLLKFAGCVQLSNHAFKLFVAFIAVLGLETRCTIRVGFFLIVVCCGREKIS